MRSGLTARPRDHHQPRPQPGHTISSDHRGACRGRGGAGLTWLGWTASGRAWWRPRALLAGRRSCRPGGRGGGSSSHQPRLDWTGGRNWWWGTAALQTSVLHCRDTAELWCCQSAGHSRTAAWADTRARAFPVPATVPSRRVQPADPHTVTRSGHHTVRSRPYKLEE